jgi:hypothetical protein
MGTQKPWWHDTSRLIIVPTPPYLFPVFILLAVLYRQQQHWMNPVSPSCWVVLIGMKIHDWNRLLHKAFSMVPVQTASQINVSIAIDQPTDVHCSSFVCSIDIQIDDTTVNMALRADGTLDARGSTEQTFSEVASWLSSQQNALNEVRIHPCYASHWEQKARLRVYAGEPINNKLGIEEKKYVEGRKPHVKRAMEKFLGMKLEDDEVPTVSLNRFTHHSTMS